MGKKRDAANENIKTLIDELIEARKEALGAGNCPHYGVCPTDAENCDACKTQYYTNMRDELLAEYIVR